MRTLRLKTLSILGVASLLTACADEPVGPGRDAIVPFAIGDAQRAALAGALRYAGREESLRSVADRDAAARIVAAVAGVSDHVARNDRSAARRALQEARDAIRLYQSRAASDLVGVLELEILSLALDHAELLAADAPDPSLYDHGGSLE